MGKLPLKIRILEYASQQNQPFTAEDILRDLKSEYTGEKQFNINRIRVYIQSFIGVKFFKEEKLEYDQKGELIISCSITDYGKSRVKYFLKHAP
ncbi:hypothetical protein [Bacillus salipaludis]|uniref:WYL domain-containing protein n=1 Tax=Bacillus salipaludis TaxID=2547811 RepID=A0ABW8RBX9_9BACI